ncbi:MAG: polysaccharide deacetylase family protein [Bacteroidales bacterium]|nr:polysaccharide deacetylase family protein [Bacteroidales bacterium]
MLIERPPRIFRSLFPGATFRLDTPHKQVMLTFDDGPIPEATPEILGILRQYGVKATFFLVGDNVRKYPHLLQKIVADGHSIGNHTMHHLQGLRTPLEKYMADVESADTFIGSPLFRPPHGLLTSAQLKRLGERHKIVMYDLVTRDYSRRLNSEDVYRKVVRLTRPGSIIVFHDSLRSIEKLRTALPRCLEWLRREGYECITL